MLNGERVAVLSVLLMCLIVSLPRPGMSQEKEKKLLELEEVVVTGTKTEKLPVDVPIRTEIITGADIEAKGAVNFYEALDGMPGIRVEQQCSYCNFSVVRMQGLESGHVQVLIDGEPTFSGLAGVYGLQQIPAANIGRIEIVKGAGSALYGSSAIAGVINIITKKPSSGKSRAETTIQFGGKGTNNYTVNASTGSEKMDVMITAQKNTGDIIDENNDFYCDRVWTDNVTLALKATASELLGNDKFSVTAGTINESRKGGLLRKTDPADPTKVIKDLWENPFGEASESIDTRRYEVTLGYRKGFTPGNELKVTFAYNRHLRDATNDAFLNDYMETHDGAYPPIYLMRPYIADEHMYVTDVTYSHPIGEHTLLSGFQYRRDGMEETGMYCIVEDIPNLGLKTGDTYMSMSEKHADDLGIYLQGEFSIRDDMELVGGVRYDAHHSEDTFAGSGKVAGLDIPKVTYNESAFSPRLGVMYKPASALTLRGSLGTGFRVPYTFNEDLHLCSGSPRVFKPGELSPERSVSFSVSADYMKEGYMVSANIFRTNLMDKIGFVEAPDVYKSRGYSYMWNNIGDAHTQGIELGFKSLPARDLTLDLNFTYTDARYEKERDDWAGTKYHKDSKYIPRVPRTTGGMKLDYSPGAWELVLDCVYTGSLYIDYFMNEDVPTEIKHTEPFVVVNSKISRELARGVSVYLGAKNLFDYVQDDKRPDDAAFMWAPYIGRIVYGGMKVTWE